MPGIQGLLLNTGPPDPAQPPPPLQKECKELAAKNTPLPVALFVLPIKILTPYQVPTFRPQPLTSIPENYISPECYLHGSIYLFSQLLTLRVSLSLPMSPAPRTFPGASRSHSGFLRGHSLTIHILGGLGALWKLTWPSNKATFLEGGGGG